MVVVVRQATQYIRLSLPLVGIAMLWHPLRFQASEEPFHGRVIPAISTSAHTLLDSVAPQYLAEFDAGVMGVFNRSSQHWIVELILDIGSALRQVFSSRVFFEALCLAH
jgi:hypothetical protein